MSLSTASIESLEPITYSSGFNLTWQSIFLFSVGERASHIQNLMDI